MAYYPFAPQLGARYVLSGPDGTRCVFNDPNDPDYIGMLTEVSGLDSADVRESASELVGADGGTHGDFYFGRRPIALTGMVINHATAAIRDLRLAKLRRATNALRSDATLTWQPSIRQENLAWNPSGETGTTYWTGSAANVTNPASAGGIGSNTFRATATAASAFGFTVHGSPNRLTAIPGQTIHVSVLPRALPAGRQFQIRVQWWRADGGGAALQSSALTNVTGTRYGSSFTAPSNAVSYHVEIVTNGGAVGEVLDMDGLLITTTSAAQSYIDGTMANAFWQGDAHASPSGDFIEMYVPVRLQNRRFAGGWNKEFQLGLVSEFAVLFSSTLKNSTGSPVTVENRGDYPSFPIIRITGSSVNPTVTVDSLDTSEANYVLTTTGLTLAAGEAVEIDTLNHTATFVVSSTRNGQSANRYIDFGATSRWPQLCYGQSTVTLGGSGTLSLRWRDVWA